MLTSAPSKLISRAMIPLSLRLTSSLTRRSRCFIFKCSRPLCRGASLVATATLQSAVATCSQFLRSLFELITFDDVAHLIFAEIAELDAAFESLAHFFHVVLKTADRSNATVVNRLSLL